MNIKEAIKKIEDNLPSWAYHYSYISNTVMKSRIKDWTDVYKALGINSQNTIIDIHPKYINTNSIYDAVLIVGTPLDIMTFKEEDSEDTVHVERTLDFSVNINARRICYVTKINATDVWTLTQGAKV